MRIGIITDPPTVVHSCAIVGGQLAKNLVRLGQEVHLLGYNYSGEIVEHPDGYKLHPDKPEPPIGERSVRAFLETVKPDIMYGHGVPDIFGGAISACAAFGIPFVPHTFFYPSNPRTCVQGNEVCLGEVERVEEFIVCNSYSLGLGVLKGKRVWYLPNGVDTSLFTPEGDSHRTRMGLKADDFVVLFSGTNNAIKDPERAILAFQEFQAGKDDTYLAMHTRPVHTHSDLKAFVNDLQVKARVLFFTDTFPEWLALPWNETYPRNSGSPPYTTTAYADMPRVYRTGDVQIVTSSKEGMSTTILEGMACGLPMLCSDDEIVSEPLVPFQTGIVVPKDELNAPVIGSLAEALDYFYSDRPELERMARNSAELARIRHDWRSIARQLLRILATILLRAPRLVEGQAPRSAKR